MLGRIRKAAVLAAMLGVGFGVSGTAGAVDYHIQSDGKLSDGSNHDTTIADVTTGSASVISQAGHNNATYTQDADVTVSNGASLVIGKNPASSSSDRVNVVLTGIPSGGGGFLALSGTGSLDIYAAENGSTSIGSSLTVDQLKTSPSSEITLHGFNNGTGQNKLTVHSLSNVAGSTQDILQGTVNIGANSIFEVATTARSQIGAGDKADLNMNGGTADFSQGNAILKHGTIAGSGTVKGNVELDNQNVTNSKTATISVANGNYLTFTDTVTLTTGSVSVKTGTGTGTNARLDVENYVAKGGLTDVSATAGHGAANFTVNNTLTVSQSKAGTATEGFIIKGANATDYGKVTANRLVMNPDITVSATEQSLIEVGGYGHLEVGYGNNGSVTDELSRGGIVVAQDGTASFYNTVNMKNGTEIKADAGEVTFYGKVNTSDSVTNQNYLKASSGGTLTFKDDLALGTNDALVLSNGGVADYSAVGAGLDLTNGQVVSDGNGAVNKYVDGKTLTGSREDAVVIKDGSELQLRHSKDVSAGYGEYVANAEKSITFDTASGGGTFTVGDMTVTNLVDGDIYSAGALAGGAKNLVNIKNDLHVEKGANAKGNVNVNTVVEGKAYIDGTYDLADTLNQFDSDIIVNGTGVLGTSGTTATITQEPDATLYVKNGGTLGIHGGTLTINPNASAGSGTSTNLVFNGTNGAANSVYGTVNALKSDTTVSSNLTIDGNLNTFTYAQTRGLVNGDGSLKVLDDSAAALVTGSTSVFAMNGTFLGGLNVSKGATLLGNGNTITGGSGTSLSVDGSSAIDLSRNSLALSGFDTVDVGGRILFGYGDDKPYSLDLGGANLNTDVNNSIQFTEDFVQRYYDNGSTDKPGWVIENGVINGGTQGEWSLSTLLGDFNFVYNDQNYGGEGAYVSLYNKRDLNDFFGLGNYLGENFGHQYINDSVIINTSGVNQGTIVSNGSMAGDLNAAIYQALKNPGSDTFTFGGRTGSLTSDLFAVMSGTTAAAPIYIAQDSTRHIMGTLDSRLDAFRKVRECVINECFSSDTALGSADILNDRYLNRIWAGALGSWQNANERDGYEGYKYKPVGGIVGYDRALGAAMVGGSLAFLDGKYEDKTFQWNDSKIQQYAANLYGTYNFSSGFFTTVKGGYMYQRNKLNYGSNGNRFDEKSNTHTLYASGKLGYDIMPCDNFSITPSIGVNYFYTKTSGHDVNWSNTNFMRYDKMTNHQVELPVEVAVSYEIPFSARSGLTLSANGGYSYNFTDRGVRGDISNNGLVGVGSPSAVSENTGRKLGHHAWMAGAGTKFRYDNWEVGVRYDYYGRKNANNHQITGVVGYSF